MLSLRDFDHLTTLSPTLCILSLKNNNRICEELYAKFVKIFSQEYSYTSFRDILFSTNMFDLLIDSILENK